jgi:cytochrome P450
LLYFEKIKQKFFKSIALKNINTKASMTKLPYRKKAESSQNPKSSDVPQVPSRLKLIQLIRWIKDPLNYLEKCTKKYGDIFTLNLMGFEPFVIVGHPEGVKEIFAADSKQFDSGRGNNIVSFLVGENSLILLDGDRHKQHRKLLMPPFHGEKVNAYGKAICQITEQKLSNLASNKSFLARNAMQDITLEVILQVVFGLREGDRYQKIKPLLASVLDVTGSPLRASFIFFPFLQQDWGVWSPWGRMLRQKQQIYDLLQAEIEERRSREITGNDVLSLMLLACDEDGQKMTDAELKDEMMTLLIAGHETTATALAWAFYWLGKLPDITEKLQRELDTLEDPTDPIAISRLPYLTAVCQETLRLYPILMIAFPRIAKQPIDIMGHHFEPDTILFPSIYLIHQREDIYPEPKKFKPERFLDRSFTNYEYFPFGGSNRRCLGYALAMLEMKLVLATVLSRYQLILLEKKPIEPQRRGLTIAPTGGVKVKLEARQINIAQEKNNILSLQ